MPEWFETQELEKERALEGARFVVIRATLERLCGASQLLCLRGSRKLKFAFEF